jgi:tetratricopeptide (TPR) repeat protein
MVALRFVGWPAIIWQFIMFHSIFKHVKWSTPSQLLQVLQGVGVASLIITPLMLSLIFKTGTRYIMGGIVALVLGLMLFYQSQNAPVGLVAVQNKLSNTANKVNLKFIDVKQQRPLDYAEQPVTYQDPYTIRLGTAFEVLNHYFVKTVLPYPMAFYYGFRVIKPEPITGAASLAGLLVFMTLALLSLLFLHKNKLLSTGIFIYLASLVVFSGFFYPVPGLVAERFMFIATIGWSIFLCAVFFMLFRINTTLSIGQWSSIATTPKVVFSLLLVLYSGLTFSRNFDWKDDLTLFRHDISYVTESAQANNLLAIHLIRHSLEVTDTSQQRALRKETIIHLKKTVEISPTFFNANYDLGRLYAGLNMPDSALVWFTNAYKIKPDYIETTFNIADVYLQRGQYQPAIPYLEYAIKHRPADYRGYSDLSFIYFQLHDFYKSMDVNRQAIANISSNAAPYINIGNVYLNLNKPDSAALWAHKALEVEPTSPLANKILQQAGKK